MKSLDSLIASLTPELIEFRRHLHAHPELAFQEVQTAATVAERLEALPGMQVRRGMGGTGVVGLLGAERPGRCVALRADMDALPITETTGHPYASRHAGVMHACGHDGHVACLVGAAQVLSAWVDQLPGPVKFIFQPAEEGGGGALHMRDAGVLDDPPVTAIFALHAWPFLPVNTVGFSRGIAFASTDALNIRVTGAGTHAASPHHGIDPIVAGAHIVTALQSVVSRQTSPTDSLVVTLATFQAGTTRNVIPPTAEMTGTIRALDPAVRRSAADRIRRIVAQTAAAFGAEAEASIEPGYPMVRNDERAAGYFEALAAGLQPPVTLEANLAPSLGGEDFAYFAERVPGLMWRLGIAAADGTTRASLHHPEFDFNDAAIPVAVRLHCLTALRFDQFQ